VTNQGCNSLAALVVQTVGWITFGQSLATALGDANAILMPNHGAVTVGADASTAVMFADLLERDCRSLGAYPYCHLAACVAVDIPGV
jgi:ribulose-5-phosphate 4-epimerase/fuculose-1-phosphate aldolase